MDPRPIKHPAVLLAYIRDSIEPQLNAAGYKFESRNNPQFHHGEPRWIDYTREDDTISIRFDRTIATIVAELLAGDGTLSTIAEATFDRPRTHGDVMREVLPFIASVNEHLQRDQAPNSEQAKSRYSPDATA